MGAPVVVPNKGTQYADAREAPHKPPLLVAVRGRTLDLCGHSGEVTLGREDAALGLVRRDPAAVGRRLSSRLRPREKARKRLLHLVDVIRVVEVRDDERRRVPRLREKERAVVTYCPKERAERVALLTPFEREELAAAPVRRDAPAKEEESRAFVP